MPWTKEVPAKRYPSDLTDEEWQRLEPLFEEVEPYTTGRPREKDLREIVNAIFYLNKTGCQWRYLPKDFPSYKLISYYHHQWVDNKTWEKINTIIHLTPLFIGNSENNWVEMKNQARGLWIAKQLKEPQNLLKNRVSMVGN